MILIAHRGVRGGTVYCVDLPDSIPLSAHPSQNAPLLYGYSPRLDCVGIPSAHLLGLAFAGANDYIYRSATHISPNLGNWWGSVYRNVLVQFGGWLEPFAPYVVLTE